MNFGRTPFNETDPYLAIGVAQEASKREVSQRYRERMRGVSMHDPRFQQIQQAKETLTKPRKRIRADLLHAPSTGLLDELLARTRGQRLDFELARIGEIALAMSEVVDPAPGPDLSELGRPQTRVQVSSDLGADPIAAQVDRIGP
ncbi:MAG: hypothetical protein HY815_03855 [Candidatus Riflebacteria bacterium]|nr:hypothetical protein [Candidatus Riflebacteria bacterium]